jgi:hypothetical protein
MDVSGELIKAIVVLLPGFVCIGVIRSLVVEENRTDVQNVIRALVYSFLIYCLYPFVARLGFLHINGNGLDFNLDSLPPHDPIGIAVVFGLSALLGLLVAAYCQWDGHKMLRWLKLTSRTARKNIWHDVFVDKQRCYVAVCFKDGRQIFGWPEYYSDDSDEGMIFLTRACWYYDSEGERIEVKIPEPGILIRCPEEIAFIQFVSAERGNGNDL